MTAPKEFNHASLSWLDRKKTRIGYARWLSSTAADHLLQSSKVRAELIRHPVARNGLEDLQTRRRRARQRIQGDDELFSPLE